MTGPGDSDRGPQTRPPEQSIGLCFRCQHARTVASARGSTFYLCRLSDIDPRFAKYPRLPVVECSGYERRTETR